MILTTIFYTGLGFLYERSENPLTQAQLRFVHPLPIDNVIPYLFADKLYHSDPVRPFLLADWKSSDRPPLQTGISLLQFPMWPYKTRALNYQILGTLLQSLSIVSIWDLMNSLATGRRIIIIVLAFCIFSGFFLLYSFYVWPKLLAASYFLFALSVLGFAGGNCRCASPLNTGIAGAAIGLALMSHGGVIFTLIALGIVVLTTRSVPRWRSLLPGILMLALFLLPWTLYQKFYDPPGDRLLKWHLAGVTEYNERSFPQLLSEAYTKPGARVIIHNKIQNVKTLLGPSPRNILGTGRNSLPWRSRVAWYKEAALFYFFQTLGVLNLGVLVLLFGRFTRIRREHEQLFYAIQRLVSLTLVSLMVWCLLLYTPGSTVIHQGSLADVVVLFVAFALSFAVLIPRLTYILLGLQVFVLFPLFAVTSPTAGSQYSILGVSRPDPGMVLLSAVGLAGLVAFGWKIGFATKKTPSMYAEPLAP